jgi:hypothetical protein
MDDHDANRTEAIRVIAAILAEAYLRLHFPKLPPNEVDCAENTRPHVTGS